MSKSEIRERERRWAVPGAVAAFLGVVLFFAGQFIERGTASGSDSELTQFRTADDHATTLLFASVLRAIAFVCLIPVLVYLFRAAQARLPAVRSQFLPLLVVGPLLFAAQTLLTWIAVNDIADKAVDQASTQEMIDYAQLVESTVQTPDNIERVTLYDNDDSFEIEDSDEQFQTGTYPEETTDAVRELTEQLGIPVSQAGGGAKSKGDDELSFSEFIDQIQEEDAAKNRVQIDEDGEGSVQLVTPQGTFAVATPATSDDVVQELLESESVEIDRDGSGAPGDELAQAIADESSLGDTSVGLLFAAILALAGGVAYTCLQSLRAGLLTRFFGSMGIAMGVALFIVPGLGLPFLFLFSLFLGLIYIGRSPGGRPPAWDAAEAMPWPPPGQPREEPGPEPESEYAIEGDAEEVLGTQPADEPAPGASEAPVRRKRKRRS